MVVKESRMRKLILKMSMSVDGFVAGPNGEIDWIFKSTDDAAVDWIVDTLWQAGVHIMGSRTFHDMAAYWPTSTEKFAAPMNEIPKLVFSRTGRVKNPGTQPTTQALQDANRVRAEKATQASPSANSASWTQVPVASGKLADEIARLKAQPGKDILAHGGASFAQSLVREALVDEYRLVIHPVALGRGLALFSGLTQPLHLKLISHTAFGSGSVAQVYRPA
jgi:dihydrofolate reductase